MKVKKNRRLAVQMILALIPVMIVMTAVILNTVYNGTVSGFLKAQNTLMSERLNDSDVNLLFEEQICGVSEWYFDYAEAHPEVLTEPFTDAEETYAMERAPDGVTFSLFWEIDLVKESDEIVQQYCAKKFFEFIRETTEEQNESDRFDCSFMALAPKSGSEGPLIFRSINGESDKVFSELTMIDLSDVVTDLKAVSDEDVVFERTRDFILDGDYYVGYRPMYINGEVRAVIGVAYDWSDFSRVMVSTYKRTVLFGIGALLISSAVLVLVIYKQAIKPVETMKESILEYTQINDSSTVKKRMSEIRVRNELGVLADAFSNMTTEIDHHIDENVKLVIEKERISAELELATNIQASQLPNVFPPFPDRHEFDIYASMTPAKEVGGDFYDFFFVDDDHLALVIADVSGKGVPAALFMMMSKILISNYAMTGISPKEVIERTNKELCRNNKNRMFVTAWLGILEISTGKLTSVNAGHECPVIKQPDGRFELLRTKHDFVLGGFRNKSYHQSEMTLQKGAVLFVYTDGVPEATNADKKMFGLDRLTDVLNETPDASPQQLLENVHRSVNEFVGSAPQFDDLTMLGIKLL